ncbi:iron complex transport system ATP-binding protein [Hathewaya proteolytica DSM 3090]|uniref:Iron complex transport system ATP-binding protein n=1 Tax=Hathewaya proteolytica DSM 3090 TaxID=1121331 RepID=A0A1M6QMB5_9CLOT|nr:ABC transporter ATP-binding protein [Hathewaya proteolytica]SHK21177.1 iron complex transport system ATP-binding protein [Hathewaya proteolytica DSM 3090]
MLRVDNLKLKYDEEIIVEDVSFNIEKNSITTIIGPNGCGKSTILKAISRTKKPSKGNIYLEDKNIREIDPKVISQKMAIVPQSPMVPEDFTVRDLIGYGRYPYLGWMGKLTKKDYEIIDWAIYETRLEQLQHRQISTMSGGERQRAWIAMALAQKPDILLLDEPTTYLDISHQFELLELVRKLNKKMNITIVMVLHDLNQAARYSDNIIVIKDHRKYLEGPPEKIITKDVLENVFNISVKVVYDEDNKCPFFIPVNSKNVQNII